MITFKEDRILERSVNVYNNGHYAGKIAYSCGGHPTFAFYPSKGVIDFGINTMTAVTEKIKEMNKDL